MKTMTQVRNDLTKYFKEVRKEGIDGADYVNACYMVTEDEETGDLNKTLYVSFFKGDDRVQSWRMDLVTNERSDLT